MADLVPADALTPKGKIDPADWYPQLEDDEVEDRIKEFLTDGTTQAASISDPAKKRTATLNWVYYRAADEVYNRLVINPSTVDVRDKGSSSILVTQIQLMKDIRDEAKAAFDDAIAVEEGAVTQPASRSYAAPIQFRF